MDIEIPDLTVTELRLFGDIIGRMEEFGSVVDIRRAVLPDLTRLLRSDFCASYVWDPDAKSYRDPVGVNVSEEHLHRYMSWYQYNDPMTQKLNARRCATYVEEVMPRRELEGCEFYNDFLSRDGLHHGINVFVYEGDRHVTDLRIWRASNRPEFAPRDKILLDVLEPYLRRAIRRKERSFSSLTLREEEIAQLVAKGCTDQDIGRLLCISLSTVRTHMRRMMEKNGWANRAEVAACVAAARSARG